jgi:hypothetical protein
MFADVYVKVSSDSNLSREFLNEREIFWKQNICQIKEESQIHLELDDFFSPLELAEALMGVAKDSRRR